jgi:hypothetical protein
VASGVVGDREAARMVRGIFLVDDDRPHPY